MSLHGFNRYYIVEKFHGNQWRRASFLNQKSTCLSKSRIDKSFDNYSEAEKAVIDLVESESGVFQIVEFTICRYPNIFGSNKK